MACESYFGCGTGKTRCLWGVFTPFMVLFLIVIIVGLIIGGPTCTELHWLLHYDRCELGWIIFGISWAFLIAATIPLYIMCCCNSGPQVRCKL